MAGTASEFDGDLVIKLGNKIDMFAAGGVVWQARSEGGSTSMQFNYTQWSTAGSSPTLSFRKARGTAVAPAALATGDGIGFINFRGHDGVAFFDVSDIRGIGNPAAAWTTTDHSTAFQFWLTDVLTKRECMRLKPNELRLAIPSVATVFDVFLATTGGVRWGTVATQKQAWWGNTPVVRAVGWAAATGTATRTTFDTTTVTLPLLAERVKALIDDLLSYGLIGA